MTSLRLLQHFPYEERAGDDTSELRGFGSPGEIVSLSFSVRSSHRIAEVELSASALKGPAGVIPESSIDLHVVHVWKQAGLGVYQSAPVDVPELLLKDDRVQFRDGLTRWCGNLRHLHRKRSRYVAPNVRLEGSVRTTLEADQPKQFWITLRIPADTSAGLYIGAVRVGAPGNRESFAELTLNVEVFPLMLPEPAQNMMIWYKGSVDCRRSVQYVRPQILEAQLRDIREHGFRSISFGAASPAKLQEAVNTALRVGFRGDVILEGPVSEYVDDVDFGAMCPVAYVSDEIDAHGTHRLASHSSAVRAARSAGIKSMASVLHAETLKRFLPGGDIGEEPDLVSLYAPNNFRFLAFHSEFADLRTRETWYYWQSHMEKPTLHRLLAGIHLWKSGAGGISPYCYQHLPHPGNSPFDDFDDWEPDFHPGSDPRQLRDHMTTYPARTGVIHTVQWKGLADGITDLRYLTAVHDVISKAETSVIPFARQLAKDVRSRLDSSLARFPMMEVEILSESEREPYSGVGAREFHDLREQAARDAISLQRAMAV
jgi:hypothetical protein